MTTPHPLRNSFLIGLKAVRLETLNDSGQVLTRATGFVIKETDGSFLYTCWHVITGVNFLQPAPMSPPVRRALLRAHCQNVEEGQPGVRSIGNSRSMDIALYDTHGQPEWLQEPNDREQLDLETIGIRVPKFYDVVRIPIELGEMFADVIEFTKADVFSNLSQAGTDVVIVGYPHGYSAMGITTPEPVFIKRSIASNRTSNVGHVLLDGGAAPGMSGAPVIVKHEDRWWLLGVYTGVMFPDHQYGPEGRDNDRHTALGLMAPLHIARVFMQVPDVFSASE